MRNVHYVFALVLIAVATNALAAVPSPTPAPEINPTSLSAGLALLAGGVMLVRARRRQ